MGVTHGASFPGKQTQGLEPGSAEQRQVGQTNPPRRGWRADQLRVAGGGARGLAAEQGLGAGGGGASERLEGGRRGRAAARGRRGRAPGARKGQAGQGAAGK